ncbi:acetolactate synthase [Geobacter sp. SVR]|nr:thiamine pyrophosphate-binding protein [Geobacter sp. SVR]BCS55970.1 acetolactate synthase [Geobacter sp. SVR]GCF84733.1 acetolactate synthase [Geobacter sp. SVR]
MDTYRISDYIADFVADLGVSHVFLLPGGGAMHLVDAMGKCPRLTAVPCLHEQACAIAAEAYSRINEHIGVAVVTTGPGATNAITGVAGAWIESVPMLVISGQVKRSDMLDGAPLRQKGVQEVDIISMVRPITKYAVTIRHPEDIRRELETAVHCATTGRKGPVWIDVPLDIQGAPVVPTTLPKCAEPLPKAPFSPTGEIIDKTLSLLARAERPLILAGHGIRLAGAAGQFRELVERLGVPVVTTWNALDLLPYDHPLLVGRPGVVALRAPNFAVQNCDLLLSIGSRLDNIITAYNPRGFARAAKKIVVDADIHEIQKLDMNVELPIVADAAIFLRELDAQTAGHSSLAVSDWRDRCKGWKLRYGIEEEVSFAAEGEITHFQAMDALSEAIPADTLVSTGSSGLAVEVFYTIFRNKPGQRVFLTSGLGSMGYGLPAAIGACFANGCRPMVAIESDGSLQLNIQELATLRAFNLPICLIVLNNAGYASIRNTMRNYFDGRYVGTGPEAGLWLPDLEALARTYDIPFRRISDAAELGALHELMALPRPLLIDLRLVSNEVLAPKVAALPQPDGSMLSMPLEDMSPLLSLDVLTSEMLIPLSEASLRCSRR